MSASFAALHQSGCGTKLPKPMRQACPVLAKADIRPAYRATCRSRGLTAMAAGVALKPGALVEQEADGAVMLAR